MTENMKPFAIEVEGKKYTITVQDEKDQVFYLVESRGGKPFVMGLNENATWEATVITPPGLVRKIGDIIEKMEM